ncbi:MAG: DegT/DnrJ/EryC1/StrS aminotransferase [Acidobacteria bacterium]|nr:MAG: DegT/DnrJ/EryC1/StrS aminotransferase [Acidobacteriota bacterium]
MRITAPLLPSTRDTCEAEHDLPLLQPDEGSIVLFRPYVPESAIRKVVETLRSRWVGQGPLVDEFERQFASTLGLPYRPVAVGSGTDALHLAYILADVKPGDEVIVPVFSCVATAMPLLYQGARIRFADVQPETLNIDPNHVRTLVSERTKAIVCTHYGGLPCDMDELLDISRALGVPCIEDASQAIGATYRGRPVGSLSNFTIFSFQAVKHITTGDGGMLVAQRDPHVQQARRLRWFGIDRVAKQDGRWGDDITEVGYKYQMTDVAAAMGIAALQELGSIIDRRRQLLAVYRNELRNASGIRLVGDGLTDREHSAWSCTVLAEKRSELRRKLRDHRIESNQVHFRNDRHPVFHGFGGTCPNMDQVEKYYLMLPLHLGMSEGDAGRVCSVIRSGW